jgi:hypothetical protein
VQRNFIGPTKGTNYEENYFTFLLVLMFSADGSCSPGFKEAVNGLIREDFFQI